MIKKTLIPAEVNLIYLDSSDVIVTSVTVNPTPIDPDDAGAPSRFFGGSDFNYRGVEKGYEEEW